MINFLIVNYDGRDGGEKSCLLTLKTSAINKSDYAARMKGAVRGSLLFF